MTLLVAALDLSMTSTGIALRYEYAEPQVLTVTSEPERKRKKGDPPLPVDMRGRRMVSLTTNLLRTIQVLGHAGNWPKLVIVEGPSYGSVGAGTWDRAGFWWMVVQEIVAREIPIALCPPSSRCTFATGKGGASKEDVLLAAVRRYPEVPIAGNDQADAMVMLGAALTRLSLPTASVPATHLRALDGIEWPENLSL